MPRPITQDEAVALCRAVIELDGAPDLGSCPYYLKNGEEGAYGPNTCSFGCTDEPDCQTHEPSTGWPYAIAVDITKGA